MGILLLLIGAISFIKIKDENEDREEVIKKVALILMLFGALLLAAAQPVLNWNQNLEKVRFKDGRDK